MEYNLHVWLKKIYETKNGAVSGKDSKNKKLNIFLKCNLDVFHSESKSKQILEI